MSELVGAFAALGEPTRLAAVRLLAEGPLRSSELAEALSVGRPSMSRHLRVLAEAGLVRDEPVPGDHRGRRYALVPEGFGEARGFFEELEAFWGDQLRAFKAYAEAAAAEQLAARDVTQEPR